MKYKSYWFIVSYNFIVLFIFDVNKIDIFEEELFIIFKIFEEKLLVIFKILRI